MADLCKYNVPVEEVEESKINPKFNLEDFLSNLLPFEKYVAGGDYPKYEVSKNKIFDLIISNTSYDYDESYLKHSAFINTVSHLVKTPSKLSIVTTNYDTLIEDAADSIGFTVIDGFTFAHTMDDIDKETLRKYRQIFEIRNDGHVWNALDDKSFLEKLGGYRKDRKTGVEGLTLAGLLMFGTGQAIRERFDNVFMDYRNESQVTADIRWNDRITYDGTWENNLFNFFTKVTPKLTEDLKKPFKLEGGVQRIDDTPIHKAVREGFVNMIIHADYLMDAGVLKVIKRSDSFEFTNPGILKLPLEDIYRGGNSKSRNPHMQTMLRLVGFGDNAGSGFPTILDVWKSEGWIKPELIEDTNLDQVTLVMKMEKESDDNSAEKSAESAEKSADLKNREEMVLSKRHQQILAIMETGIEYSTEQVAEKIGLKGPRTRQLLNELVNKELLACIGTTKRRRYIKPVD